MSRSRGVLRSTQFDSTNPYISYFFSSKGSGHTLRKKQKFLIIYENRLKILSFFVFSGDFSEFSIGPPDPFRVFYANKYVCVESPSIQLRSSRFPQLFQKKNPHDFLEIC